MSNYRETNKQSENMSQKIRRNISKLVDISVVRQSSLEGPTCIRMQVNLYKLWALKLRCSETSETGHNSGLLPTEKTEGIDRLADEGQFRIP